MRTLKDVIDDLLLEKDDHNSLFRNARRTHIRSLARRGLRTLEYSLSGNVRAISFNVPPSQNVELPDDFDDYVRVSIMDGCKIRPIKSNSSVPVEVTTYLQDAEGEFIYDCDTEVTRVDSINHCKHDSIPKECGKCKHIVVSDCTIEDFYWFKIEDDKIWFSPDLEGEKIIIEYLSSGVTENMSECSIKIKPNYHEPLIAWIRWQYLRSVKEHMGIVDEHRRYFKNLKRELKLSEAEVDNNEIAKIRDYRFNL